MIAHNALTLEQSLDRTYPEKPEVPAEDWINRAGLALAGAGARRLRARRARAHAIVARVDAVAGRFDALDLAALRSHAIEIGQSLRQRGLVDAPVADAFALIRRTGQLVLGKRHFDCQLIGGWVLLNGMLAEMQTGEGKTLTATLAACTAALAGIPVHVITVNDYLVARDCEIMRPLYQALGISVAAVTEEMDHASRHLAYACDVVYCSNKTLVFDYLRDRIVLGHQASRLHLQLEQLYGTETRTSRLLLRGLHFAIVDEADSVLVDEARTPLIISASVPSDGEEALARQALAIADQLVEGSDYRILRAERRIDVSESGHRLAAQLSKPLGGPWNLTLRREELITQALSARLLYLRDEQYLVRDDKVQVIDEFTGRVMADRSWSQGLHQMIEVKEGCEITARREPLARISYQRFFRRYLRLSGMTGTAAEVSAELGSIYDLAVVGIPTNVAGRRICHPDRIFASSDEKWRAIAERVAGLHAQGIPVLLGTPSVAASELASRMLAERALPHQVLNAKQDHIEADMVARAGEPGRITIATNMAGRGTDIHLATGVKDASGLFVILAERHESRRIDRQLEGRCARQGDPGSFEAMLSLDDAVLWPFKNNPLFYVLNKLARREGAVGRHARRSLMAAAQSLTERGQAAVRKGLFKSDQQGNNVLSFTGKPE